MAIINGNNTIFATLNGNQFFIDSTLDVVAFVYGWHVDPSISDPAQAVTYLADAVGKTPAAMGASTFSYGDWADAFFMPKPCMLKYDGTVDYYLNPNDYTKKADGTASDIADPNYGGNAMMEWPLIWYKFEAGTADGEGYFYCSNKQVDSSYKCWCNYDANDNIIPHFYTAIYNGTGTAKLCSLSGVTLTAANGSGGTTGDTEIARAETNNIGLDKSWYIETFSDRTLITALLVLMSKSLDMRTAFGKGLEEGNYTTKDNYCTGTLNNSGLFYGSPTNGSQAVKVFGMENWWGCVFRRIAGLFCTENGYSYKLTYGAVDGSAANGYNATGIGYISTNIAGPGSNGFISKMSFGGFGMLPSEAAANADSYYCSFFGSGHKALTIGGRVSEPGHSSPFFFNTINGYDAYAQVISACISCKPVKK